MKKNKQVELPTFKFVVEDEDDNLKHGSLWVQEKSGFCVTYYGSGEYFIGNWELGNGKESEAENPDWYMNVLGLNDVKAYLESIHVEYYISEDKKGTRDYNVNIIIFIQPKRFGIIYK